MQVRDLNLTAVYLTMPKPKLKRELGLFSTTLYGVGVIIGAGIYALIGIGAGIAGNMLWFAFFLSAIIAVFTGLSYAELSSVFPKEAAEYNYARKASGKETLSFLVGWLLAIGTVIAASTVALGFGGYFYALFGVDPKFAAAGLLFFMACLNYIGIKESAFFNNFASVLEVLGLLVVIAAALIVPPVIGVNLLELPSAGIASIATAVSIVFFAYIGFENVANISEEVKNSTKIVPKALMLSLAISTILYMLVAIAAVREVGWAALSTSNAPLTLVVSRALGSYSAALSVIALFSTGNTVLVFLIASSRMLYGISEGGSLPKIFSAVGSRGTPYFSILLTGAGAFLLAFAFDIKTVAQLTNLSVFIAYLAVNLSLIALANTDNKRSFTSPRFFNIPVLAWFGAISAFLMLLAFEPGLWLMQIAISVVGILIFLFNKRRQPATARSR